MRRFERRGRRGDNSWARMRMGISHSVEALQSLPDGGGQKKTRLDRSA